MNYRLWFDVEMIRYTTNVEYGIGMTKLWFDVEMIRYTTEAHTIPNTVGCGLM